MSGDSFCCPFFWNGEFTYVTRTQRWIKWPTQRLGIKLGHDPWKHGWLENRHFLFSWPNGIFFRRSLYMSINTYVYITKSKDQTLPIASGESFTWIILKNILCLVDWTFRVLYSIRRALPENGKSSSGKLCYPSFIFSIARNKCETKTHTFEQKTTTSIYSI